MFLPSLVAVVVVLVLRSEFYLLFLSLLSVSLVSGPMSLLPMLVYAPRIAACTGKGLSLFDDKAKAEDLEAFCVFCLYLA